MLEERTSLSLPTWQRLEFGFNPQKSKGSHGSILFFRYYSSLFPLQPWTIEEKSNIKGTWAFFIHGTYLQLMFWTLSIYPVWIVTWLHPCGLRGLSEMVHYLTFVWHAGNSKYILFFRSYELNSWIFVNHFCVDVHTVILYTEIKKEVFIK